MNRATIDRTFWRRCLLVGAVVLNLYFIFFTQSKGFGAFWLALLFVALILSRRDRTEDRYHEWPPESRISRVALTLSGCGAALALVGTLGILGALDLRPSQVLGTFTLAACIGGFGLLFTLVWLGRARTARDFEGRGQRLDICLEGRGRLDGRPGFYVLAANANAAALYRVNLFSAALMVSGNPADIDLSDEKTRGLLSLSMAGHAATLKGVVPDRAAAMRRLCAG